MASIPKYKAIESVVTGGLQLPSWMTQLDGVSYEKAKNQFQVLEQNDLNLQKTENELLEAEKNKIAKERIANEFGEKEITDYDEYLNEVKKIYLDTGNYDEVGKVFETQQKRADDKAKANEPRIMQDSSGTFALYPDLTIKDIRAAKEKSGEGKKMSFSVDYHNPQTGATAKVNILDPQELAFAESQGYVEGKESPLAAFQRSSAQSKQPERDLKGVTVPEQPSRSPIDFINSMTQPKAVIVKKENTNQIPKAK